MTLNFTRGLSNWTQGTATATNGSRTVTFSGANLIAADPSNSAVNIYVAGEGDKFIVDGVGVASIASVDSASQITLDAPWPYASQTAVAYKIRRYNEVKTGEVAKYIQAAQTVGQDANPFVSLAIDDSVARGKLRETGGNIEVAVGASGAADGSLKAAMRADPASGYASFPNGYKHNNPGFRNRLINGNFDVWQRGASITVAASTLGYHADRWLVWNGTSVSWTFAKVAAPAGFRGAQALQASATGVGAGQPIYIHQRMEARSIADLDGKACVLSFDLNASTTAGTLTAQVYFETNTAVDNGTFSAVNAATTFAIPPGSATIAVPLSAAQAANLRYGAQIVFDFTQNNSTGNPTIILGAVQLEADPSGAGKANDFEFRPLPFELALCQRYFETSYDLGIAPGTAGVSGGPWRRAVDATTSTATMQIPFAVKKRSAPTVTLYSPSSGATGQMFDLNANADFAATAQGVNQSGFMAQDVSTSIAAGHSIFCSWTASAEL